jgi:hypothetical protein
VRAFGMQGVNLTIPHKVAVIGYLDEIAPDAAIIGAVNTVRRDGNRLIGENTDGKGFLRGVRSDAQVDPRNKRIVVLGAGGAARAIVELALASASDMLVLNRSVSRGVRWLPASCQKIQAPIGSRIGGHICDCANLDILNATSACTQMWIPCRRYRMTRTRNARLRCHVQSTGDLADRCGAGTRAARLDSLSMLVIGDRVRTVDRRKGAEPVMKEALRHAMGIAAK